MTEAQMLNSLKSIYCESINSDKLADILKEFEIPFLQRGSTVQIPESKLSKFLAEQYTGQVTKFTRYISAVEPGVLCYEFEGVF